jgi:ABC-type nitrate/sulfonate/bicarbonate transport system substrate-binding protein
MTAYRKAVITKSINRDRLIGLILLFLSMAFIAAVIAVGEPAHGGDRTRETFEVSELRYQGWASQVLASLKLKWVGNTISGPRDIQSAATGDTDFGGAFSGAIVKLVAAGAPIKAVVANYGADQGNFTGLYVLDDSPIKSPRDLIGKSVGMNTLGAYQEYLLTDYLLRNGFTKDDVKQVTLIPAPPVNLAQMVRQRRIDAAFLSDITRDKAVEQGGVRALMTDVGTYGPLTLGGYVLTDKFIAEKPNAARVFVEGTAKAIEWARATPRDQVVGRMQEITRRRGRTEDPHIVDYWKSVGVASKGGVLSDQDFAVYIDWYGKLGQLKPGQVSPADLYTNRFNPYRDLAAK